MYSNKIFVFLNYICLLLGCLSKKCLPLQLDNSPYSIINIRIVLLIKVFKNCFWDYDDSSVGYHFRVSSAG